MQWFQPWTEFFYYRNFGLPLPLKRTVKRIKMNISYFLPNYVVVALLLSVCLNSSVY